MDKVTLDNIINIFGKYVILITDKEGTTQEVIDWTSFRDISDEIIKLNTPN